MGAPAFRHDSFPGNGWSPAEGVDDELVALVGRLLELSKDGLEGARGVLAQVTARMEYHAGRVEHLLQRAGSSALGATRRGHEALLLRLEGLQAGAPDSHEASFQVQAVCTYLLSVLAQDAAAVRYCAFPGGQGALVH